MTPPRRSSPPLTGAWGSKPGPVLKEVGLQDSLRIDTIINAGDIIKLVFQEETNMMGLEHYDNQWVVPQDTLLQGLAIQPPIFDTNNQNSAGQRRTVVEGRWIDRFTLEVKVVIPAAPPNGGLPKPCVERDVTVTAPLGVYNKDVDSLPSTSTARLTNDKCEPGTGYGIFSFGNAENVSAPPLTSIPWRRWRRRDAVPLLSVAAGSYRSDSVANMQRLAVLDRCDTAAAPGVETEWHRRRSCQPARLRHVARRSGEIFSRRRT